jgi:site-specific recombinase XerD
LFANKNGINWSNRSAIVLGKGDKERVVYFNIRCEIWLKRYLDLRQDKDPAIFVTERHRLDMSLSEYQVGQGSIKKFIYTNYATTMPHTY